MVCPPVRRDNPRALTSKFLTVKVNNNVLIMDVSGYLVQGYGYPVTVVKAINDTI